MRILVCPKPAYPGAPFRNPLAVPGAPYPENPGTFPGAPYPETPSSEVLQGNALARGAQSGQPLPGAALGQIPARKRKPRRKLRTCKRNPCNPRRKLPQRGPRPCFSSIPSQTHPSLPGMLTIRRRKPRRCNLRTDKFINTTVSLRRIGPITDCTENQAPGKGFQAYIKKRSRNRSGPHVATVDRDKRKIAHVQEAPPASANELLERYIGIF